MTTPVYAIAYDPDNRCWLHFTSAERVYTTRSVGEVIHVLAEVERACKADGRWAVGWVSYEAAPAFDPALTVREEPTFPKIWFATFPAPTPLTSLPDTEQPEPLSWHPSVTKEEYLRGRLGQRGDRTGRHLPNELLVPTHYTHHTVPTRPFQHHDKESGGHLRMPD